MNKYVFNDSRFDKKKQYIKIRDLFMDKKYSNVVKEASIYLEEFPNDINVRFMRAKSYRRLEMFKEAIEDLKYNLKLDNNPHSITELYFLYYYLNMYNEALELLPQIYEERFINAYSVSISELIMKLQLGIDIKVKKDAKCEYLRSQIFNYSTIRALNHINECHIIDKSKDTNKSSWFNENIDLNYLFEVLRNNIENSKKVNTDEMLEIYYFGISNIGYSKNAVCNYIKVIVVPNTNNIINMYPTNDIDHDYISDIDIDYDKLFKRDNKVKTKSRINRFKEKYNM